MSKIEIIGCMDNTIDHTFESANRIYDVNGISPTINTCGGGGLQPKIMEVIKLSNNKENIVYDDYNSSIRSDQNTIGTLTTHCGSSSLRDNYKIIEKVRIKQATKKGYIECEIGGWQT